MNKRTSVLDFLKIVAPLSLQCQDYSVGSKLISSNEEILIDYYKHFYSDIGLREPYWTTYYSIHCIPTYHINCALQSTLLYIEGLYICCFLANCLMMITGLRMAV